LILAIIVVVIVDVILAGVQQKLPVRDHGEFGVPKIQIRTFE